MVRTLCWSLMLTMVCSMALAAESDADESKKPEGKSKLLHVVAVKFKEGTTTEQIAEVESEFRALKKKIKQVKEYAGGASVSVEKLNKDFQHCSILEFKNIKELKEYMEHEDHKAFVELLKKHLADVFVIDFWE